MKFPIWKIPSEIDRTKLLTEAQHLLKLYQTGTNIRKHICLNCEQYGMLLLLDTVEASLEIPSHALEYNMGLTLTTMTFGQERVAIRKEWLQQLIVTLEGVTQNA